MLIETGRIVALESDRLWVETTRESTCGSCSLKQGCGQRLLNRLSGGRAGYLPVLGSSDRISRCRVGDRVEFGLPESTLLRASFIVYILPLCLMLAGLTVERLLFTAGNVFSGVAGALAGLLCGIVVVRLHAGHSRNNPAFQPVLLRRLPDTAEGLSRRGERNEFNSDSEVIDA